MARSFDDRLFLSALCVALPAVAIALGLLWLGPYSTLLRISLTIALVGLSIAAAIALRKRISYPIYTLANVLEALREGDYSLRARRSDPRDALGQALQEANLLGERLQEERRGAQEATALLKGVMAEIDVAVFAFDEDRRLRLANRASERLLSRPPDKLIGQPASSLGLEEVLAADPSRPLSARFPGGEGRWGVRHGTLRQEGRPLRLLVLSDLSRPLREEERQAWRRLIRVLGHELNNSLAPIRSLAETLARLFDRQPRPDDWEDDMRRGLGRIANRSASLSRFMNAYSGLARLPPPTLAPLDLERRIERIASLENRLPVEVKGGPPVTLEADGDQFEQLLINLVRNAVDETLAAGNGVVEITWEPSGEAVEIRVLDEGRGLSNPENLFVPFYTTKPEGTGIGLVLCRQIAEGHGGTVELRNRADRGGCEATLRLPLLPAAPAPTG
ncbi:MAG: ATP-binding protein [Acidobacteriota bacterium]